MVVRHLVPSLTWTCVILFLYAIPGSSLPSARLYEFLPLDKVAHFFVFLGYVLMLNVGIAKQIGLDSICRKASVYALLVSVGVGVFLELIQGTVFVERTTDFIDLLINVLGSLVGIVIFKMLYKQPFAR